MIYNQICSSSLNCAILVCACNDFIDVTDRNTSVTDAVGTDSCITSAILRSYQRHRVFAVVPGASSTTLQLLGSLSLSHRTTYTYRPIPSSTSIDHHLDDMSSVLLASVLRRFFCRSSLQIVAHPSSRLLFFLLISAIFLLCYLLMMMHSDGRHYLFRSRQHQQSNKVTVNSTSRSRFSHYAGPGPLSEPHRGSDSDEILSLLLKSGSTRASEELESAGDGLRSTTQSKNNSRLIRLHTTGLALDVLSLFIFS